MTTNPKPLLTRAELEGLRDYVWSPPIINTIELMAELLTERCEDLVGFEEWCGTHDKFCEPCQRKHDLLSTFNATGGDGS